MRDHSFVLHIIDLSENQYKDDDDEILSDDVTTFITTKWLLLMSC